MLSNMSYKMYKVQENFSHITETFHSHAKSIHKRVRKLKMKVKYDHKTPVLYSTPVVSL